MHSDCFHGILSVVLPAIQAEDRRAKRLSGVDHTSCVLLLDEVDRAADGLLTFLMNFLDQGQVVAAFLPRAHSTRST